MRCFLAVPVAEPALATASELMRRLRDDVARVRWARPETLHLTVHFFGQVDEARAFDAVERVTPIATATTPFDIDLDTLGAFPPRGTPRVLWLGSRAPAPALGELAASCRGALAGAGFTVESRRYRPHCTLGRPQGAFDTSAWTSALHRGVDAMRFSADRLVLFESHPGPGGSVYTRRVEMPFARSGSVSREDQPRMPVA